MLSQINLNYDFSIFFSKDYENHKGSCIKHQVHELTDIHQKYGGFPKSYCLENTLINQLWWTADEIDYKNIGKQLGLEIITVSTIRQQPGCVIPWHRDTFYQIRQQYPDRKDLKVRANIYLEDWKMGHFVQIDDTIDAHWKQGNGWLWDDSILHLGANAGMNDKFTLQISGFLTTQ
jgi:hypothetical protein